MTRISAAAPSRSSAPRAGSALAGAIGAAVLLATPLIASWEGKSNDPYRDIAGVMTVCYGETRVTMRQYSDAECRAMLKKAVEGFARPVAESTPTIAGRPAQLAAATSLAYNIGMGAYRASSARRLFLAGDMKAACLAFAPFNKTSVSAPAMRMLVAKGERCSRKPDGRFLCTVRGLTNRRADEIKLCLEGL